MNTKHSTTFRSALVQLKAAQKTIVKLDEGAIKPLSRAELDAAVQLIKLCDEMAERFRMDDEVDATQVEGELILLCENADEIHG